MGRAAQRPTQSAHPPHIPARREPVSPLHSQSHSATAPPITTNPVAAPYNASPAALWLASVFDCPAAANNTAPPTAPTSPHLENESINGFGGMKLSFVNG